MPSRLRFRGASALIVFVASVLLAIAQSAAPSLKAILEIDRDAYYSGDPVPVRISIWNDGAASVSAPGGEVAAGFSLFDQDGNKVAASAGAAPAVPGDSGGKDAAARTLAAGAFFGFARDLTTIYPRLKEPGTYRLQWSGGGVTSNAVILRVVPRYDSDKDYTARIETTLGAFTLEFLRKDAPIAVKTFIELAQSGFYDGLSFYYVEPDRVVVSGDPSGTGEGGPGFGVPHERPPVKMLTGTVILRATGRPPMNGSIFAVLLAPRPDYEGSATGFAQVVDGLDVVRKISQVPASPKGAPQPHRPLEDIKIVRVVVKLKPQA